MTHPSTEPGGIPEIDLRHLRTLTDDTGIYQHALFSIPDRTHGYCTDDNARALVAALRYRAQRGDDSTLPLCARYLSFLHSAFDYDRRRFRNFLSYDRRWLEEVGSEDSHARALWALGETVALAPNNSILHHATRLFHDALPAAEAFENPRPWAFTLVGIHAYLSRFGEDAHACELRATLAHRLYARFREHATPDRPWCEDVATYSNAKLPHALLLSGQWLPDGGMFEQGLRSLDWLLRVQTGESGCLSPIGCDGWFPKDGERAPFDQQPVEPMSLIEACAEAYRATRDPRWTDEIRRCLDWFLGRNDIGALLYDADTGGCHDGLNPEGANLNQGAESTLSWLISLMVAHEVLDPETPPASEEPT